MSFQEGAFITARNVIAIICQAHQKNSTERIRDENTNRYHIDNILVRYFNVLTIYWMVTNRHEYFNF